MLSNFYSIDPVDNSVLKKHLAEDWQTVLAKISKSSAAFDNWKNQSFELRETLLLKAADILEKNAGYYAKMITQEMGKPFVQAVSEVHKCALVCRYYAKNSAAFLKDLSINTEFKQSYISYQPLGTILQIMPWNFPFWQVFRFAAPALMSGNVTLLKHSPNVLGCADLIQEVFDEAGFPEGVFQNIYVDIENIENIMKEPAIQGVALTGSLRAGKAVGALAGKYIKNSVLELGGSDPFIVLEDADLEKAAKIAVQSRMHNSGQTCISAKRFIVVNSVAKTFKALVIKHMNELIVGEPMNPSTDISAMSRRDLAETLQLQVDKSIKMGAVVGFDGGHKKETNYFYPMLLTNVKKGMPAYDEELFGPVITFFEVKNSDEAIQLANDSVFGLAATVWSENQELAKSVAMQLQVGAVAINRMMSSNPGIPFGGVKMSGIGRELGREGLLSFVNLKSVIVG